MLRLLRSCAINSGRGRNTVEQEGPAPAAHEHRDHGRVLPNSCAADELEGRRPRLAFHQHGCRPGPVRARTTRPASAGRWAAGYTLTPGAGGPARWPSPPLPTPTSTSMCRSATPPADLRHAPSGPTSPQLEHVTQDREHRRPWVRRGRASARANAASIDAGLALYAVIEHGEARRPRGVHLRWRQRRGPRPRGGAPRRQRRARSRKAPCADRQRERGVVRLVLAAQRHGRRGDRTS